MGLGVREEQYNAAVVVGGGAKIALPGVNHSLSNKHFRQDEIFLPFLLDVCASIGDAADTIIRKLVAFCERT